MMFQAGPLGLLTSLGSVSKTVLLLLLFFSVVSWTIIFYKWRTFRALGRDEQQFLAAYARAQDPEEVRHVARRAALSPSAGVARALLERVAPEGNGARHQNGFLYSGTDATEPEREYLQRVAGSVLQDQMTRLESYLPFLATTGNITPFIGLLGTVLGIIDAFREIGHQGTASIAVVAPGVAEALVATAAGLFAAIPAVVAYNYFLSRLRKVTFHTEAFSIECVNALQSRAKRVEVRG